MLKVVMDTKWWSVSLFAMTWDSRDNRQPACVCCDQARSESIKTNSPMVWPMHSLHGAWEPSCDIARCVSCPPASVITILIISPDRWGRDKWGHSTISDVMTRVIRRPRDTSEEGWPHPCGHRWPGTDLGLTTAGQCQCHSPQTPGLAPLCLSPVWCSHRRARDILINPLSSRANYDAEAGVIMRCQHGVNYVVCKQ